ncbi:hypothetical protein Tco_0349514 [Tanacetum coccineum]
MPTEMELTLEQTQQGVSYEVSVFTIEDGILLEPTSNKHMSALMTFQNEEQAEYEYSKNNFDPRIRRWKVRSSKSFRHSDTERFLLEVMKFKELKNFKKDATLKLSKSTNQERYEHVGPEVTSPQDGKDYKMA